jgi:hypothetical protein
MSFARGFGLNGKSIYMNVAKPMLIAANLVVDHTNGNGLGIRSLKSNGYIENVFMNTTAAPGTNNGHLNPNPLPGFALIQFKNNFNAYLGGFSGFVSTVQTSTKIDNGVLVVGQAYVITVVGNSTLAQWQAIGVPQGLTPSVGMSFIAITTGAGANVSTSRVMLPKPSGILAVEVVGDPNQSIANSNLATNAGAYLLLQFLAPTVTAGAYGTPMIPTAPADGSVFGFTSWFDGSTVTVDGI